MKAESTTNKILPWQWVALFILLIGLLGAVFLLILAVFGLLVPSNNRILASPGSSLREFSSDPLEAGYISATPFQPLPSFTATPIPSFTPTPTSTFTLTPTETPIPTATSTPPPSVEPIYPTADPDSHQIEGVVGYAQLYSLDCEARSAVDWAAYFGISIDELEFLARLPSSDNPDIGFVGSYYDETGQLPPASYGVHAGPVADLLREYGLNAEAHSGASWEDIKSEISANRPVIAWVINHTYPGYPVNYIDSQGQSALVARFEHTVIITGFDSSYVTILDGSTLYYRTISEFLDSWSVLGNMIITQTSNP